MGRGTDLYVYYFLPLGALMSGTFNVLSVCVCVCVTVEFFLMQKAVLFLENTSRVSDIRNM